MTVDADRVLSDRQRLARGHAQLPFDEIETGDHLGHRVLDLQAGVHLEEEEAICVRDELHRAGAFVADSPRRGDGGASHGGSAIVIEARRGRLLDHLLMAPLHRAVALEQVDRVAVPVGEHLHLDVPRMRQIALEQHAVIAEGGCGLLPRRVQRGGKFVRVRHDPHAATAAAGHRLDHQREADAVRLVGEECGVLALAMITGQQRHAGFLHQRLGRGLRSHGAHRRRRRPDEDDAGLLRRLRRSRGSPTGSHSRDGWHPRRCAVPLR